LNAPRSEFLMRYGSDTHVDMEAMRLEFERLRDLVETRAQMQERQFQAALGESQSRAAEALQRYGPVTHVEIDAMRLEVERLRDLVETRAQVQERQFQAMLGESQSRVAEALEPRIQFAALEAMAFAEQRLERQEAALRALGRRFAEFAREAAPEATREFPACETAAYALGAAGEEAEGARLLSLSEDSEEAWLRDAAHLPIAPGGASRLVAANVIEHIAPAALESRVLPHWRSRLATGGELVVVTLDGPALLADLAARADFALWRERMFGPSARALRNLLDAPALVALLTRAGFTPEAPTRGDGFVLRVVARA
jgi:hypothetical protein